MGEDNIALREVVVDGVKLVGLIGFFLWQGWLPCHQLSLELGLNGIEKQGRIRETSGRDRNWGF